MIENRSIKLLSTPTTPQNIINKHFESTETRLNNLESTVKQDREENTILREFVEKSMKSVEEVLQKIDTISEYWKEKKTDNTDLSNQVHNQTQIIKDLNVEINEKDEKIKKLQKLCEEKDNKLHSIHNNMKIDLLLKDEKITSLETMCKEKDCQLNSLQNLKQDLIIKGERLTQLERLCKDKDNQLSSLQNILRESLLILESNIFIKLINYIKVL